jgi:hypothetical protein
MQTLSCDAYSAKGDRACCTVRATAAVLGISFNEAHSKLKALGRKDNQGFSTGAHLDALGLEQRPEFSCRTLGKILPELSHGRFIVAIRHHVFAVIDGIIYEKASLRDRLKSGTRVQMVYKLMSA